MLFDHDSAESLRTRAEVTSHKPLPPDNEEVKHDEGHAIDAISPGNAATNLNEKHHAKFEPNSVQREVVIPPGRSFGITVEDVAKFDNDVENLAKYGGAKGVANLLKVDPKKGIDGSLGDLVARASNFGENTYPVSKIKPFWSYIVEALQDPTLMILIGCAGVSLTVGLTTEDPKAGWYDGGGICFAIILVLLVSSTSNYRQSLQFRALSAENQKIMVNVTRGGKRLKTVIFELVVGDIVHLGIGDQIPGDGLLIHGSSLIVDESSMTGESEPAVKDTTHPFLISGCKVLDGTGSQLITAVGMNTEWGKVMATLAVDNEEETPLQVRLNHLAETIGKIGITVAVSVFLVLVIRLLVETDLKHFGAAQGRKIVDFFAVAVTIIVVAVPEGLPLAVTLTLAYSMHKMMDDRALVRNLSACETMGSATTICSDKTGTLTMNLKLFGSICLNTNGHVGVSAEGVLEVSGSPTEVACLNWAVKVMARSSPTDKHTLVKRLLEMGDIVAVTGDGTNDAPALHEASIGLAMGIAGTEVAKESADIIILDDNFASIVKVVRWGRSVYANIQKFIQFQCTVNGVALGLNFIASVANGEAPLTAVQLLWVNLIMDTMGALALATEPPNENLMLKNPVNKREPLITNIMWRNIFGQFAYQLILLLVLQFRGKQLLGLKDDEIPSMTEHSHAYREVETMIFNAFVFCQVFNELNARKPEEINVFKGLWTSKIFMYVIAFTVTVQVLLVELCGSFTSTVHLSWHRWLLCIAFGAVSMPLAAIIKCIPVSNKPIWSSWQHRDDLVFREGGSVMSMMLRQGSQKVDLQRTRSVKSTKFYTEFSLDVANNPPADPDSCFQKFKRSICPAGISPSANDDVENPNKRHGNEAWR